MLFVVEVCWYYFPTAVLMDTGDFQQSQRHRNVCQHHPGSINRSVYGAVVRTCVVSGARSASDAFNRRVAGVWAWHRVLLYQRVLFPQTGGRQQFKSGCSRPCGTLRSGNYCFCLGYPFGTNV